MPIITGQFTLGTVAIQVVPPTNQTQHVTVHNAHHGGNDDVYIGPAGVTITNGYHIHSDDRIQFEIGPNDELWAVSDAGTPQMDILRIVQD